MPHQATASSRNAKIRPRHHFAIDGQRQHGELTRLERRDFGFDLQRIQAPGPMLVRDDGSLDPFAHWITYGSV